MPDNTGTCEQGAEEERTTGAARTHHGGTTTTTTNNSSTAHLRLRMYLYVTGGRIRGKTLGSVERFNFSNSTWEEQPRLIENRGSHGAVSYGSSVIVIGGGGFKSNLSTVEKLQCDVDAPAWELVAPMTTTHRHALAVQRIGKFAYALGGWINGSECTGAVEKYDIIENKWFICAPLLFPRRLHGAAALTASNRVFVFGGNANDGEWYTNTVEAYDVETNTWTQMNDLPSSGPCSAIAVGGGDAEEVFVFMHGKHVLWYNAEEDSYEQRSALPLAEWYCFDVATVGKDVYCVGGAEKGKWSKAFYRYDTAADSWEALPSMHK